VLTQQLVDFFDEVPGIDAIFVDSSSGAGSSVRRIGPRLAVPFRIMWQLPEVQAVTVHLSSGGVWSLGVAAVVLSKLAGQPVILRRFGGADLLSGGRLRRAWTRWVLRNADIVFVETSALVAEGEQIGQIDVRWFPNSRPLPEFDPGPARSDGDSMRFVFVGQVRSEKGIRELIAAGERLGPSVVVDVFGPVGFDIPPTAFEGLKRVRYRGVLSPEEVPETLRTYDALVLPSHYAGEGHPGVIVEAYGAGLPVVATRWRSIPEIVDSSSGILVDPCSSDDLYDAMRELATGAALYQRLAKGSRKRAERLDSRYWNRRFIEACFELVGRAH
jgi:glycosyltransferase involved in cell wall biosynthesis